VAAPEPAAAPETARTRAAAYLLPSQSRWPIQAVQNPVGSCDPIPFANPARSDRSLRALSLRKSPRGILQFFPVQLLVEWSRKTNILSVLRNDRKEFLWPVSGEANVTGQSRAQMQNAPPDGDSHRVGAIGRAELLQDFLDVHLHGAAGGAQAFGDVFIGKALRHEGEHFHFARR
jgi:hypothetical protein